MPVLLAFGDSNTHGSAPNDVRGQYRRFGPADRWPGACAAALGPDWTVIEEGLPGRTAQFEDPVMGAHMDGGVGLRIALNSHGPIDVLAIMLGTNDLKTRFAPSAQKVTAGIAGLVDVAQSLEMQTRHGGFRILLICPPNVVEADNRAGEFLGASDIAAALPAAYEALAKARGAAFLDANDHIAVSRLDGIHYDEAAHRTLGAAIAKAVSAL